MKISFHTFGCKCNLYDSNQIASLLSDAAFFNIVEGDTSADIHVINTCTVTSSADAQARNLLRQIDRKNKGSLIVVIGCSVRGNAQGYMEIASGLEPGRNRILVIDNMKEDVASIIAVETGRQLQGTADPAPVFRTRAFVKITDGCNNFCSYCIIPHVRGRERSRPIADVVNEVRGLEAKGLKETVITGISIGDYSYGLEDLMEELLRSTSEMRFRISSLRPSRISEHFIELMREERLCPHIHVSLQSASDKVLRAMNRNDYTAADFCDRIRSFHRELQHRDPFIAADVIVGFPGEGEEEFNETLKILENVPVNKLHVFAFSPRPGTKAYDMKKVSDTVVRKRRDLLLEFSQRRYLSSLREMNGKNVKVLWEDPHEGYTENYYPAKGRGTKNTIQSCRVTGLDEGIGTLLVEAV